MKKITIIILMISYPLAGYTQQDADIGDPFDLSSSESKIRELGIVTKPEVDALEARSRELFNSEQCEAAIPVLDEYARKANWLANMISKTLEPYYGASYDDKQDYPGSRLRPLVPLETLSNEYKQKRNIAFAMQGECLLKTGNKESALPVLINALDLISIDNEAWWNRTRDNLLTIVEVELDAL